MRPIWWCGFRPSRQLCSIPKTKPPICSTWRFFWSNRRKLARFRPKSVPRQWLLCGTPARKRTCSITTTLFTTICPTRVVSVDPIHLHEVCSPFSILLLFVHLFIHHINSSFYDVDSVTGISVAAFQIYDDLSDAWSQEDDEISEQYLHLRLSLKVSFLFKSLNLYHDVNQSNHFSELWLNYFRIEVIHCLK